MHRYKNSLYAIRKKLLIIMLSITFLFCALFGRLTYLQLFSAEALQLKASAQWYRDLPLMPKRGLIYSSDGYILANTSTLYDVYVRPRMISNESELCKVLSDALNINYDTIYQKVHGKKVSEITIAKRITREQMLTIKSSGIAGIYFSENILRYYPYGDLLSQVLGYIDADNNGQSGLELYYNKYLYGTKGSIYTDTDLTGIELANSTQGYISAIDGNNIILSIDYHLQTYADSIAKEAYTTHNAKSASVLVLDCETGGVLAMATAPSVDLNNLPRDNVELLLEYSKNQLVSSVYEPGSTFKIITCAAAIEEGIVDDNSRFYCNGSMIVDGTKIKCWKTKGHGSQTFAEAVSNSCNCAFMQLALKLGKEKMYNYIRSFGLNETTGIDCYGETAGITLKESLVKNVDLARIGFGHAIAVTPIGLLSGAVSAINGGKLYTPSICKNIVTSEGLTVLNNSAKLKRTTISNSTSNKLRELLERVVSQGGGKMAYVDGYRIGGKTGTAQKYGDDGKIASGKYISSFLGFAPADNPKYAVLIIVDEPSAYGYYGSIVAAPYAKTMFTNIFNHYGIQPDEKLKNDDYYKYFDMPNLEGLSAIEVGAIMRRYNLSYETEGDGDKVTSQIPVAGTSINSYTVPLVILQ